MLTIKSYGATDTGLLRSHNEDYFEIDESNQLYIVADGIGGQNHGEVASRLAVNSIREFLAQSAPDPGICATELLRRSIEDAQEKVLAAMRDDDELLGMGTTVVSAMLHEQTVTIAHVGDSRCYRARNGELELLTQDHTWVNEMVMSGQFTQAEVLAHPLRNVVTRAIGGVDSFKVDIRAVVARPGDLFLLCTDGLNSMLSDQEIEARMTAGSSLREVGGGMIDDANSRGGIDNTTIVLLQVEERQEPWRSVPRLGAGVRGVLRRLSAARRA